MATAAVSGYSTTFKLTSGTAMSEVTSISGVSINRDTIEATNLSSPTQWKEFIFGLKEGGEITVNCNYTNTAYQKLVATEMIAGTVSSYTLTLPDATTYIFPLMLPIGYEVDTITPGEKLSLTMRFKPSGPITVPA
jgi:hypothetical protein